MSLRRMIQVLLPAALAAASLFGGCGTDAAVPAEDAGPSADSELPDRPSDQGPSPDVRPPPEAAPDVRDGAPDPPVRAPFGLDARPPNPTCTAPARPPRAPGSAVRFTQVFAAVGLNTPVLLTQIPGDRTRFFVAERGGTVVSFPSVNPTAKTVVATVPGPVNQTSEGGLLGMAFHPRFAVNGYLYLSYTLGTTAADLRSVIIRMHSPDNGLTFGDPVTILGPFQQGDSHYGGDLHFGPDGYLYASFGDGWDSDNGQRTNGFFAKILRIDVDSAFPYAIPDGNPFKSGGGEPAAFAYGFRNPYRFSFDPVSGDLWAADVGEADWEEVNRVVAGGNYGWREREGAHCFPPGSTGCRTAGLIDPWWEYDHETGYCAIGGPVYRGSKMPTQVGRYLVADCGAFHVFSVASDPVTGVTSGIILNPDDPLLNWIGFGEDNDHEVYVISFDSKIYALDEQPGSPPPPPFPDTLSKTGCFDPADARKPASGLIPFAPNSPFWSDGAEKERFLALPDGTAITINGQGDFDFPVGTVLVKHFRVDQKLVETRLFVRHADGEWGGYSYEWNDTQTDATLLPSNKTKALAGGKSWYYPGRAECMGCHTQAAGRSLGLELGQLNGDFVYAKTNRISNQLRTLDHLALFAQPLADPSTLPVYPSPSGTAPLESRARSYLHANCAHCHQPGGPGRGNMDLRFGGGFSGTRTCNAAPLTGDLGVVGAKLLVPGSPGTSLVSLRLRSTGPGRMPPLATKQVDSAGGQLMDDWIRSVTSCPP